MPSGLLGIKCLIAEMKLAQIRQEIKHPWSCNYGEKVEVGQDQTLKSYRLGNMAMGKKASMIHSPECSNF